MKNAILSVLFVFLLVGSVLAIEDNNVDVEAVAPPYEIVEPPVKFNEKGFYKKCVFADGYPIVASEKVSDYALYEAAYLVNLMLAERPDVRKAMIESDSRLIIMARTEMSTDIPEYSWMRPKKFWDRRARGFGGSQSDPVCSVGEENILAFPGDPYHEESIFIHEFAHNIHLRGLVRIDKTFDDRVKAAYDKAMEKGLWKTKYAATNHHEYFAEGVQSWFDDNRENDHDHNHVNTRKELIEYDPDLATLCEEVFGKTELKYIKPTERKEPGHLAGYDFTKSPRFEWPEGLNAWYRKYNEEQRKKREQAEKNKRDDETPAEGE